MEYRCTSCSAATIANPASLLKKIISAISHELYRSLGQSDATRQQAYRMLFRSELDADAIDDIRLTLNQNQPLGNERFHAVIEKMTGTRREANTRGGPRLESDPTTAPLEGQQQLGL
jgi:putative transposase